MNRIAGMHLIMAALVALFTTSPSKADVAADSSFASRCKAAGVVQCIGFEEFVGRSFPPSCGGGWPTSGGQCYNVAGNGSTRAFLDQSVYASGDGGGKNAAL